MTWPSQLLPVAKGQNQPTTWARIRGRVPELPENVTRLWTFSPLTAMFGTEGNPLEAVVPSVRVIGSVKPLGEDAGGVCRSCKVCDSRLAQRKATANTKRVARVRAF